MSEEKKSLPTLPTKQLTFKVGENEYTTKFPNNGQLMQMQSLKHSLTGGQYNSFVAGLTVADQTERFAADMTAFFITCVPDMKKDLKIESFSQIEAMDRKLLLQVYVKQVLPWLTAWEDWLNSDEEVQEKKD